MCDLYSEFWWLQPPRVWRWRAGRRGCGGRYCVMARLRERVVEDFWRPHGLCLRHQLLMRKSGPPSRSCLPFSYWAPHYGTRFLRVSLEFNSLRWKFRWIWWQCPSERARTPAQDPIAFPGHSLNPITALLFGFLVCSSFWGFLSPLDERGEKKSSASSCLISPARFSLSRSGDYGVKMPTSHSMLRAPCESD